MNDALLQEMVDSSAEATLDKLGLLPTPLSEVLAEKLSRIVAHIDVANVARKFGDTGSADASLDCARDLALELLGLKS